MAKRGKRRGNAPVAIPTAETAGLTSNPFSALANGGKVIEPEQSVEPEPEPEPERVSGQRPLPSRAIVRLQRKGRGGKEVTLIELRGIAAGELEGWLTSLKRELGAGGFLDGDELALLGDQRERVRASLERRGVAKITVS